MTSTAVGPPGQDSLQRCPYCFTSLPRESLYRVCLIGRLDDGSPCRGATPQPYLRSERPRCPDHPSTELVPRCHNPECERLLPERWSEVSTTCLAMAGTRASGKTVYIAVTADLLIRWGRRRGMTITHYNEDSRASFERRFGQLHSDEGRLLPATEREGSGQRVEHQEPILLRIQRPGVPDHVLVLRDVAGEDLQNAGMDANIFRFLTRADGLILMIDPGSMPKVRNALVGLVEPPASDFPPDAVWGNLQALMFAINGDRAPFLPVALTISKFDLVLLTAAQRGSGLDSQLSSRGLRMRMDPSLALRGFNSEDCDLLDMELRALLAKLDAISLLERVRHYEARGSQIRTFAVSSLGHAPTVGKVAAQGKTPFRCLDPIMWFLYRAGVR